MKIACRERRCADFPSELKTLEGKRQGGFVEKCTVHFDFVQITLPSGRMRSAWSG